MTKDFLPPKNDVVFKQCHSFKSCKRELYQPWVVYEGAAASTPKELDLEGYVRNAGLLSKESCIVGGDVPGIAQRSRTPLDCGALN
jgi:hypothetical protein